MNYNKLVQNLLHEFTDITAQYVSKRLRKKKTKSFATRKYSTPKFSGEKLGKIKYKTPKANFSYRRKYQKRRKLS